MVLTRGRDLRQAVSAASHKPRPDVNRASSPHAVHDIQSCRRVEVRETGRVPAWSLKLIENINIGRVDTIRQPMARYERENVKSNAEEAFHFGWFGTGIS